MNLFAYSIAFPIFIVFSVISCKSGSQKQETTALMVVRRSTKEIGSVKSDFLIETETAVQTEDSVKTDASEKTSIFCIIAGSYPINDRKNAEMEMRKYAAKGLKSEIIETPTRLRICIGKFPSETEALKEIPEYCKTTGRKDLWVLKFLK